MKIKVKGYLTLKDLLPEQVIQIDDGIKFSLKDLLDQLTHKADRELEETIFDTGTRNVRREVAVLVNGSHYTHIPDGLDTLLQDEDEIAIFPPIAGG